MNRFTKWCLALALVVLATEILAPNTTYARSRWLSNNGFGMGVFPGAVPRSTAMPFSNFPFPTGPAVSMHQNPMFYVGPMVRRGRGLPSPNPFYHYNVPYGGYYWRPY